MVRFIGKDRYGLPYYAVRFQPGCFDSLPWNDEECDCIVWVPDPGVTDECLGEVASALAGMKNDWIEVAGHRCEELHDAIDQAAVRIGRQKAVGDGHPMTAWNDDIQSIPQLISLACQHAGNSDQVLLIVVGAEVEFERAADALCGRLH